MSPVFLLPFTRNRLAPETDWIECMLYFALGDFVRHPSRPEWGAGQVQSIVGLNVTVNFVHAGKQMINCAVVELIRIDDPSDSKDAARFEG